MDWQSIPKTELHLHLEGAAPIDFIKKQSAKKGIDLSHVIEGDHYKWRDFNDFLKTYEAVMRVLTTPQDFADLTRAVLGEQSKHGVKYTEIFLGTVLMADNDPALWNEMLAAIETASNEMEAETGIIARYIGVIVRHFGIERAEETARLVGDHRSPRLTGFGMAGAEDYGRPADFTKAFRIADEAGFGLTCHAGEWMGSKPIRETIETLKVTRLGHGVRSVEDKELLALIRDLDIHLEVNPGSNIALGAAASWAEHQIHQLRDMGISLSISTDDPPYFSTTMTREYEELGRTGWTLEMFDHTNREAMRHAFCDEETRRRLMADFGGNHA